MEEPKVSIIVPVYNCGRYLAETLRNVLDQTWANIEIIVVDDGSTDDSGEVARAFMPEGVKIITTTNRGAAHARNVGLKQATGRFIQFLDGDDLLAPDKISIQMRRFLAADNPDTTLCAGQWLRFGSSLDQVIGGLGPGGPAEKDMSSLDWLLLRPYNLMTIHGWLTPKALLDQTGPWNETLSLDDDGEYFLRVVAAAHRVLFCPGAIAFYRTVSTAVTLSRVSLFSESPVNCVKLKSAYQGLLQYRTILRQYQDARVAKALERNFMYMAFNSYLACREVYQECVGQPEMPRIQRIIIMTWLKGWWGACSLVLGWRWTKRLMAMYYLRFRLSDKK